MMPPMSLTPEQLDRIRRNSQVALDREGRWTFQGQPVEHPRVVELFHRGVQVDPETGAVTLHVGPQWCYVQQVEDTPFFVARVRAARGGLTLHLLGDRTEPLDPATLVASGDAEIHCTLASGARARFLREALLDLEPYLAERDGALGLQLDDSFFPLGPPSSATHGAP